MVGLADRLEPDDAVGERWIGRVEEGHLADQAPWHFLYFLPEPHGHGSLRPTLSNSEFTFGRCATGVATEPPPLVGSLERIADLRRTGALSEHEYDRLKQVLLGNATNGAAVSALPTD